MKANFIILLSLCAVAGIKSKACNTCNTVGSSNIELINKDGQQIHLASQSASSSIGSVSNFVLAGTKNLVTGKITCKIPEEFVELLKGSRLISKVVSQNQQTFLHLVFNSSIRGSGMGAVLGGIVGAYLLGKSLYRVVKVLRSSYPEYGQSQRREEIDYLTLHPESRLARAYALPELLIGLHITKAVENFSNLLLKHSPLPKKLSEYLWVMISGTIPWAIGGALVGAIAGPAFLALNPQQAVSVTLTVAHDSVRN